MFIVAGCPALKHLGLETTTDETIAIMHKYDTSQDGKLDIVEFNGLVMELSQFLQEQPPPPLSAASLQLPPHLACFFTRRRRHQPRPPPLEAE